MFKNLVSRKNLSIDRLVTLCHVVEAGSLGAATGGNPVRQSQYSRQIAELSRFLGVPLLDRRSRPHRVTEAGVELGRLCRIHLGALDDFVAKCKSQPSRIVVGAGESLIQWLLIPGVLPRLREAMPETGVILRNFRTEATIDALQNGEIDLGFVRRNAVPKTLKSAGSFQLGYRLFIPKKFRAKLKPPVTLDQLTSYPMAVLAGTGQYRSTLEQLATDAGVQLNFETECSSSTQVALLVARKECCAILPGFARNQLNAAAVAEFPVKGLKDLERTLCFAWNPKQAEVRDVVEKAARVCAAG